METKMRFSRSVILGALVVKNSCSFVQPIIINFSLFKNFSLFPGSKCERLKAENFARNALKALKFCQDYAECAESLVLSNEYAE